VQDLLDCFLGVDGRYIRAVVEHTDPPAHVGGGGPESRASVWDKRDVEECRFVLDPTCVLMSVPVATAGAVDTAAGKLAPSGCRVSGGVRKRRCFVPQLRARLCLCVVIHTQAHTCRLDPE
jgi:hypothetical protein